MGPIPGYDGTWDLLLSLLRQGESSFLLSLHFLPPSCFLLHVLGGQTLVPGCSLRKMRNRIFKNVLIFTSVVWSKCTELQVWKHNEIILLFKTETGENHSMNHKAVVHYHSPVCPGSPWSHTPQSWPAPSRSRLSLSLCSWQHPASQTWGTGRWTNNKYQRQHINA